MTHDRSTGGDDTLFADLERELGGQDSSASSTSGNDPLAELARLIEESRGGAAPAARPAQPQPAAAAPRPPEPQPRQAPAPKSYGDDIASELEESLRGMDFSTDADPFAQPGDMSSDMTAQPVPQKPAPRESLPAPDPVQASMPSGGNADDPFASLESALSRVVADNKHEAPPSTSQPAYGTAMAGGHNPYAVHTGGHHGYEAVPEPGIQYDDDAPEFTDPDEGASPYDETGYEYDESPRSRRGVYVVGALIGLVVVGGAAAYGFKSFMNGGDDVPLVQASNEPVKTMPEQTTRPEQQGKLVYDRIGGSSDDTASSQIVPREEQVAIGADGRSVRVISGEGAPPAPPTGAEDDSKRVRTLTVRPDGQIETPPPPPAPKPVVAVEQPTPAPEAAPAIQSEVPVPRTAPSRVATNTGNTQQPVSQLDVLRQNAQREAQSQGVPLPLTRPAPTASSDGQTQIPVAVAPAQIPPAPPAVVPQRQPASVSISGRGADDPSAIIISTPSRQQRAPAPAPVVQPRTSIPVAVAPSQPSTQQTRVAAAPRQAPPARQAAAPIASGYVVQVASSRSEADAQSALSRVQGRAGGALSGYQGQVQRADLGTRGVFFRAAFGPMQSSSEANSVCNKLKSSGIDCFVR